ncbi:ATP-binding cassette domain-containing protein [Thermosynechococcus sp. HN-54]|uniref:ATP-binding cassette domain-containing protein n=1 Tax=Thermosynechococcus sp. HN-54 TaxID=2933959 RepID=UPI00202D0CD0|nr:ATP-binding cassette domain-containing protein [Thermosynechococcus sp. HN-54]URR36193.1 ATP-binding cassette domain-containing protein [Thermosynechococcus sp. HN-54]
MRSPAPQTVVDLPTVTLTLESRGQTLTYRLSQPEHRLGRDQQWADFVVPDEPPWLVISSRHAVFKQQGATYYLFDGDGNQRRSTNGTFYNRQRIGLEEGFALGETRRLEIGQDPANKVQLLVQIEFSGTGSPPPLPQQRRLVLKTLKEWPLTLGRQASNSYQHWQLDAPTVSLHHASIDRTSGGLYVLRDLGSSNGTYVNDKLLTAPHTLRNGDLIRIGPFVLLYRQETLEITDQGSHVRIDAWGLERWVKTPAGDRPLLADVCFVAEPKQLVGIVGGSGTGKSTLLKVLMGLAPVQKGQVLLNGLNLHRNIAAYRHQIGYVPQEDILHSRLTVEEVLNYAAQLRLPADTDAQTRKAAIQRVLEQVQLTGTEQQLVANLSGGQRKRVSIAVELLANPKLFFLDEPTSGLDPGLDFLLMQLLRELADQERTIVLVTHATSHVNLCDRLLVMGAGGRLCYFGPSDRALAFFSPSSDRPLQSVAEIYALLTPENSAQWSQKFRQSADYQHYLASYLSMGQHYERTSVLGGESRPSAEPPPQQPAPPHLYQWRVLCQRQWQLLWRDRLSLVLNLISVPIALLLTRFAIDRSPFLPQDPPGLLQAAQTLRILFVFTCACLWVGLSGWAQALITEVAIYRRERLANLSLWAYMAAKLTLGKGMALVQTLLITLVGLLAFGLPRGALLPWPVGFGITTFLTLVASLCLGLLISAAVNNSDQASKILPPLLLPQIIFAGVLFKLTGVATALSWLTIGRWTMGAYGALIDVNGMVPPPLDFGLFEPPPQPFDPTPVYAPTWGNLLLNWGMLILHSLIYTGVATYLQRRKG